MCEEEDDGCQREVVQQVMGIVEIKKTNVGEQVYQQMKNQILAGVRGRRFRRSICS